MDWSTSGYGWVGRGDYKVASGLGLLSGHGWIERGDYT